MDPSTVDSHEADRGDAPSHSGESANGQDEAETTGPQGDDGDDPDVDVTATDADGSSDTADSADAAHSADTDEASDTDSSDTAEPQVEVADPVEPAPSPEDLHEQAPLAGSTSSEPVIPDDVVAEVVSTTGQAGVAAEVEPDRDEHRPEVAPSPAAGLLTLEVPGTQLAVAEPSVATQADTSTSALVAVTSATAVEEATPTAPQPLSPLAELLQLPGCLFNALLQVFDLTESASSPPSPISFEPINNLLFAAFRELERLFGLDRTPAGLRARGSAPNRTTARSS